MADKTYKRNRQTEELFKAVLTLETVGECYAFFEDICTMKELADLTQRIQAARMLLEGATYEQIVKKVAISTATISRINRCIQYGEGGYKTVIDRVKAQEAAAAEKLAKIEK